MTRTQGWLLGRCGSGLGWESIFCFSAPWNAAELLNNLKGDKTDGGS